MNQFVENFEELIAKLSLDNKKEEILASYHTQFEGELLISIDLMGCGISKFPDGIFDKFIELQKIFLSHNNLPSLPKDLFKNLINLTHLDLRGSMIESLDENIFQNQQKLRRLEINDNFLEKIPVKLFSQLYSLEELNLSNNRIEKIERKIFENLGHLKRLYLYFNPLPRDLANGDYYDQDSVIELINQLDQDNL